ADGGRAERPGHGQEQLVGRRHVEGDGLGVEGETPRRGDFEVGAGRAMWKTPGSGTAPPVAIVTLAPVARATHSTKPSTKSGWMCCTTRTGTSMAVSSPITRARVCGPPVEAAIPTIGRTSPFRPACAAGM